MHFHMMTRPSIRKINVKEQERDNNGRFAKKIQTVDNWGDDVGIMIMVGTMMLIGVIIC